MIHRAPALLALALLAALPPSVQAERVRLANQSQRIDQRVQARPEGRAQLLKAEKPEESKPLYTAMRKGQTEVRPAVSVGTSGLKKKRLVSLDIE